VPNKRREGVVEELLELVGMGGFRSARAHYLSGGETQRVAMARALACEPEVILLDEPTSSVDVENQGTIERIIREINREKAISVIFTTHDMVQTSRLADETMFLFEGKVARSIYENIFSGRIEADASGEKHCVLSNGVKLRLETGRSGPVRISITPDRIHLRPRGDETIENSLAGRVIQLNEEQSRVRVLVDVGFPVNVLIPKSSFTALGAGIGDRLLVICPRKSIDVF
jgi:tungstate transport system ATP-binding protein